MKKIFLISTILFIIQSCAPIIGTVGIASIGASSKEKGLATTLNDNIIKRLIQVKS